VDALRARIDAALEEPQQVPTGSGEQAHRPETHGINARPPARADVRWAEPVPKTSHRISRGALRAFEGAEFLGDLRGLGESLGTVVPTSESEQLADCAQLAELLRGQHRHAERSEPQQSRRADDGRARRATFKKWLRERTPLVYAALHDDPILERLRRAELARIARERRAALAYCVECHNPLLATEYGFQFCPYERAEQHSKVKALLRKEVVLVSKPRSTRSTPTTPTHCPEMPCLKTDTMVSISLQGSASILRRKSGGDGQPALTTPHRVSVQPARDPGSPAASSNLTRHRPRT
jgi:hypothetical protein